MASNAARGNVSPDRPQAGDGVVSRVRREYRYYKALIDDPRTPSTAKWLIGSGVGYVMLPFDLIPDVIPIIGKLDDMLIAPALIGLGCRLVPEEVKADDRSRSRRIRQSFGDGYSGPVVFNSSALPGPFGIRIDSCGRDPEMQGPVLFPLLDLMYEYGFVVVTDHRATGDRFDSYTMDNTKKVDAVRCSRQVQLDVNFRPLPLVASVMHYESDAPGNDRFVNSEAAYAELPARLGRTLEKLRLRWQPCPEIQLEAVLDSSARESVSVDAALPVSGAQFINLIMSDECEIASSDNLDADELEEELREHVLMNRFCCEHRPSAGELLAWNPRQILYLPSGSGSSVPRHVYPGHLSGTLLGH